MTLPRILVLDDLTGWSESDRRTMCENLALADVTNGETIYDESKYLAEAVFHPAQIRTNNLIKNSLDEAIRVVGARWGSNSVNLWALILLDLQFDEGKVADGPLDPDFNWPNRADREFGLQILRALSEKWPDEDMPGRTEVPVVALSASPRERAEDELNNLGNLGYLQRESPNASSKLREQLADHLFHFGLLEDCPLPCVDDKGKVARIMRNEKIVGNSLPLLRALRAARKAASAPGYSLLLGPIGSGKELFARFIHDLSERAKEPYETLNCAAIPESLIESELFGHERGAFTDAAKQKLGRFELANKGTIFLDEIGYMSSSAQTRLLRVLEGGFIQRLGATSTIKVDVKVIAATNQDLQSAVKNGSFKGDLLSRIKHYEIRIPSLNDRRVDIKPLFDYFLEVETRGIKASIWPKRIDPKVYELLAKRNWDAGNVRELRKKVASIASDRRFSQSITPNDISPESSVSTTREVGDQSVIADERASVSLRDAEVALREACISSSQADLNGTLTSLQRAYGGVVMRLLDIALEETKAVTGELRPTTAVKLLLGREQMSAPQAASYLLSLSKIFPNQPLVDSDLARAISWATNRRRANSKNASESMK